MGISGNSIKIRNPNGVVKALEAFLDKIGCFFEGEADWHDSRAFEKPLYFSHNALMGYAMRDAKRGIHQATDAEGVGPVLELAAESAMLENIVYAHVLGSAEKSDIVFRLSDPRGREIDIVVINREEKRLRLIVVEAGAKISDRVFEDSAPLFDPMILRRLDADSSYAVTRAIAHMGETSVIACEGKRLVLANIEELLLSGDWGLFLDELNSGERQTPPTSFARIGAS
jgi:hypothetical protein